jgi:hypothetical protein
MNNQNKMTFNYFITHRVIPQVIFADMDAFYEKIIQYAGNIQLFMNKTVQHATGLAADNPDIEPAYPIEFEYEECGNNVRESVICVRFPKCAAIGDCTEIVFPRMHKKAGYYTAELSGNISESDVYFKLYGWKLVDDNLHRIDYGEIEMLDRRNIAGKVINLVYDD